MLAAAILLFIALLCVLFILDFGTDLKPGVMTKIKTLLTHFQVCAIACVLQRIEHMEECLCPGCPIASLPASICHSF